MINLTDRAVRCLAEGQIRSGMVTVLVIGSTAGISTTEYEPGLVNRDLKAAFEAQWSRDVLSRAIEQLGEECKPEISTSFRRFHLENGSVKEIARELSATETQVAHYLRDARAELRRLVTDQVRAYVQDESEVPRELDSLFNAWK